MSRDSRTANTRARNAGHRAKSLLYYGPVNGSMYARGNPAPRARPRADGPRSNANLARYYKDLILSGRGTPRTIAQFTAAFKRGLSGGNGGNNFRNASSTPSRNARYPTSRRTWRPMNLSRLARR